MVVRALSVHEAHPDVLQIGVVIPRNGDVSGYFRRRADHHANALHVRAGYVDGNARLDLCAVREEIVQRHLGRTRGADCGIRPRGDTGKFADMGLAIR